MRNKKELIKKIRYSVIFNLKAHAPISGATSYRRYAFKCKITVILKIILKNYITKRIHIFIFFGFFYFPKQLAGQINSVNKIKKQNQINQSFFWRDVWRSFDRYFWSIGSVFILKPFNHGITLSFFDDFKRFKCLHILLKFFCIYFYIHNPKWINWAYRQYLIS